MKKLLILLSVTGSFAFGFRGCLFQLVNPGNDPLYALVTGIHYLNGDGSFHQYYLTAGAGGNIYRSTNPVNDPWVQRPSGTTNNINCLKNTPAADTAVTFGAGDNGTIVRSLDEGMTWTVLNSSVTRNLNGIDFQNMNAIIAVGDSGLIIKSTNGGNSWNQLSSGVTKNLNSVYIVNSFFSIVAGDGGTLLRTSNGGTTWEDMSFADTTTNLNKIGLMGTWFFGNILGIVGDNGILYQSTNYTNWNLISTGTSEDLYDIRFKNSGSGFVTGENGTVRYTIDGGLQWYSDPFLNSLTTERISCFTYTE